MVRNFPYFKRFETYPDVAKDIRQYKKKLSFGFEGEVGAFGQKGIRFHGFKINREAAEDTIGLVGSILAKNITSLFHCQS